MTTITVMRGLPGSGKTVHARRLQADARDTAGRPVIAVVCRDDIRRHFLGLTMAVGDQVLDGAGESVVTAVESATVDACLSAGMDVVVDATNLRDVDMARWAQVASRHGACVEVCDLRWVSVEECVARDAVRGAAGGRCVGSSVIRRMAVQSAPSYAETDS